jgi:hypothetical protein
LGRKEVKRNTRKGRGARLGKHVQEKTNEERREMELERERGSRRKE